MKKYLQQCECDFLKTLKTFDFQRTKLLPIETQPSHHKPRSYSILSRDNNNYIIATSPLNQDYTIYNVTEGEIVKNSKLNYPPIVIGQSTFKSFDSIYFQSPLPGRLFRFNSEGEILEKVSLEDIETEWQMASNPPGLFFDIPQARIQFINKNKLLFIANPFDFWNYPNKGEIKVIAEYDLSSKTVVSNFSTLSTQLTEVPIELMDKYTFPFMRHEGQFVYVSYPYDHEVHKYDYESKKLVKRGCISSSFIPKLTSFKVKSFKSRRD